MTINNNDDGDDNNNNNIDSNIVLYTVNKLRFTMRVQIAQCWSLSFSVSAVMLSLILFSHTPCFR
jgi:hypothetical protein